MTPGLPPTTVNPRSFLQLTSSTRKSCLYNQARRRPSLPSSLPRLPSPHSHSHSHSHSHPTTAPFSTSVPRLKRYGSWIKPPSDPPPSSYFSSNKSSSNGSSNPAENASSPPPDSVDFSVLNAAHEQLVTKLKDDLVRLRPGGLDLQVIRAVKVTFKPTWKDKREKKEEKKKEEEGEKRTMATVGDLAQLWIRGRTCTVIMGEKEHVKPVLSALQSSLTLPAPPAHNHDNPLEILIPIPPTTGESRAEAQLTAKTLGDKTIEKWSEVRSSERKRQRAIELGRGGTYKVSKDGVWKGDLKLAKVHKQVVEEIQVLVETAKRRLAGV